MPLRYRFNVIEALKAKGFTTYRIKKEKLLSESTLQTLRSNGQLSWKGIEALCRLLECQPGELLEYEETPAE